MSGPFLATLTASAVVFALAMLALGLGVLAGRRPLVGSCGGGSAEGCVCSPGNRPCDARGEP